MAEKLRKQQEAELLKRQQEQERVERLAMRANSEFAKYIPQIKNKVTQNWIEQTNCGGLKATVTIRVNPKGEVVFVEVLDSSGSIAYDRSVTTAVLKASPLPIPRDPEIYAFIKEFNFSFGGKSG